MACARSFDVVRKSKPTAAVKNEIWFEVIYPSWDGVFSGRPAHAVDL
jgi:hypothetical protein